MSGSDSSAAMKHARATSERVASSEWVDRLARYGLVAKGLSYGLVGVLAGALAVAGAGKATSREGALQVVADETWGKPVIAALAAGFAAYGLWRLAQAIFDRENEGGNATGLAVRAGYLGRALIYAVLTFAALRLLADADGGSSQTEEARTATSHVLGWPAGRVLVAIVGLCFVAAGLFNAYRAFTQKFEEKWSTGAMSAAEQRWAGRIGSIGLLARFIVFGLIGAFLVKAAYEFEAEEAVGLDGALRELAQASYGPVLLGVVAAGLLCYALHCFVEARYRRV